MVKKPLNIGMVGYGFMGRTHSNAFSQVNHFFDVPYRPVLKATCARDGAKAKAFVALGRVPDATDEAASAVHLAEALAAADPVNCQSRDLLGRALLDLADLQATQNESAGTLALRQRAVSLLEDLVKSDPDNAHTRASLDEGTQSLARARALLDQRGAKEP